MSRGLEPPGTLRTTSYTYNGLTPSTSSSYTVRARDAPGKVSAPSAALAYGYSLWEFEVYGAPAGA
ncbi:hypothetical protein ACHGLA_12705 [Streptomyces sp. YH02]|uniref:hypothetical protein n=1 Tax=Streptomyces sp. YH02 TaxID=3256999 RepID=UPI0037573993